MTREELADKFNSWIPGIGGPSSPLWCTEGTDKKSKWFICIDPIKASDLEVYHSWCEEILIGNILCYSSDSRTKQEWWGFTDKNDILVWILRWA